MRLRISHLVVQPVLVWDDGEELHPGPVAEPVSVSLSRIADLVARLPAEVAVLESDQMANVP